MSIRVGVYIDGDINNSNTNNNVKDESIELEQQFFVRKCADEKFRFAANEVQFVSNESICVESIGVNGHKSSMRSRQILFQRGAGYSW